MMTERRLSPYEKGFGARLAGVTEDDCPYRQWFDVDERFSWLQGWKDQDEHLRDRDKALREIGWFG